MSSQQPIYFMHIAKTAGSYINKLFVDALGEDACVLHAEHNLRDEHDKERAIRSAAGGDEIRFISGHIYHHDWLHSCADDAYRFYQIATVREPIAHLASHIQWLDHYNRPDKRQQYNNLSLPLQKLVDDIGRLDFESVGDLDAFLSSLSGTAVQMLDNCQSRYFLCGYSSNIQRTDALDLSSVNELSTAVDKFDLIFTLDNLANAIDIIRSQTGISLAPLESRVNTAKSNRTIDINNKVVRSVLSKRSLVDQWLWRSVVSS